MSVTTSGLAFDTEIPVPISSGGSIASMSGFKAAAEALTEGLFVQTTETSPISLALAIAASISASFNLLSEWFINVPIAPFSRIDSART